MELHEFLLARIAEDEDLARSVQQRHAFLEPYAPADQALGLEWDDHMVYAPPLRVLTECDAKRRTVKLGEGWENLARAEATHEFGAEGLTDETRSACEALDDVLRFLALPYADHPDYREEWRP